MLIGLIIIVLALVFPFLHFRFGKTAFRVLGLIGAILCCLSLIVIIVSYLQVGNLVPHVGVLLFLIFISYQAFYQTLKNRKPQKPRADKDILYS